MKNRERRSFDKAFKLMVVELHKNGKSSREISRDFDIPSDMVRRWSREYSASGDSSFVGNGKPVVTPEQQEINELKKALNEAPGKSLLDFEDFFPVLIIKCAEQPLGPFTLFC
jgi:transposase